MTNPTIRELFDDVKVPAEVSPSSLVHRGFLLGVIFTLAAEAIVALCILPFLLQ